MKKSRILRERAWSVLLFVPHENESWDNLRNKGTARNVIAACLLI
jgi:hypothetical protein